MILVLLAVGLLGVFHYGWGRTGCTDDGRVTGPHSCYYKYPGD
jgi:hypothetical protein